MSFFSKKSKPNHGAKIPPKSAFGHYNKKQGVRLSPSDGDKSPQKSRGVLITAENITLSYEGKAVIDGLSFEIREGDYLCIIGENGSGKSTLMSALLGLIDTSKGKITIAVSKNEIGVLNQSTLTESDFPATVREVVLSGCLGRDSKGPFIGKAAKQKAFSAMEKLGITSLADRSFRELSGGQRQRVLIARALCSAKTVLFLDEPVTGLDRATVADVYSIIDDLNRSGMTIVTVTHDVRAAMERSSKILRINKDSYLFIDTEDYRKLSEAQALLSDKDDKKDSLPYGEGGFRYTGGEK